MTIFLNNLENKKEGKVIEVNKILIALLHLQRRHLYVMLPRKPNQRPPNR